MSYRPLPRTLKPDGTTADGDDVKVYQEVLVALKQVKQKDLKAGHYGPVMWTAVEKLGKIHGHEANNTLGPFMHRILAAHMTPAQGFRLAMCLGDQQGGKGHRVAQAARWYMEMGPYGYNENRPQSDMVAPLVPDAWDCSKFSIGCVLSAGFGSKLPTEAERQGNTYSLVQLGQPVDPNAIQPGDWVFVDVYAQNSHMFVAYNGTQGISHGHSGLPNFEWYDQYPIYGVRRIVT